MLKTEKITKIYYSSYFLIALENLKKDEVFGSFLNLLKTLAVSSDFEENISAYSSFISKLFKKKYKNFSLYLYDLVQNSTLSELYDDYDIKKELNIVNNISKIGYDKICQIMLSKFSCKAEYIDLLPDFETSNKKIVLNKEKSCDIFKNNNAFIFNDNFEIKPVKTKGNIKFSDLKGYVEQKKILYENTSALINGLKVNNILLYGDAGCGKSSSIRALLNEFKEIKIVQIFKNNLINLDKLYKKLEILPYKFIIFADDISFVDLDDNFSTMKAILEGSLIQCPPNAAIYATSNRKHLVRESFQARSGDEIHLKDTINEITSLSERFGINLLFQKPTQKEYIEIVCLLAKDNKIKVNDDLIEKAKKYAILKGSNSPRTARQLIDNIIAKVNI